jgi:hypothetical protein
MRSSASSRWFPGLDFRSLALFRVLMGSLLLLDLAIRGSALSEHYTDSGVLPRVDAIAQNGWDRLSLLLAVGSPDAVGALFGVAALAAIALILGWRTRAASVVLWVWLLAIQARNEYLLNSGDVLLRCLAFWGMLLPWGEAWSLDALRVQRKLPSPAEARSSFANLVTAGLALQVMHLYLFAGILKLEQPAWREGGGLTAALWSLQYVKSFGLRFVEMPRALMVLGDGFTFLLEGPLALLPLVSLRWWRARLGGVALFVGFHLFLEAAFAVGLFSLVSCAAWTAFLPAEFWEWRGPRRAVEAFGAGLERLAGALDRHGLLCRGGAAVPMRPASAVRPSELVAVFVIPLTFAWNLSGLRGVGQIFPAELRPLWVMAGLDQRWEMFSVPISQASWFAMPAELADGMRLDLVSGQPDVRRTRPAVISEDYRTDRWRKLALSAEMGGRDALRMSLGKYFCREWSRRQPGLPPLEAFLFVRYWQDVIPLTGGLRPEVRRETLWRHECVDGVLAGRESGLVQWLDSAERLPATPASQSAARSPIRGAFQ